jgi:phosphoglycolate phosphatase
MILNDYKAVFFDLDGTLLDSAQDLAYAINIMSDELGIDKPSLLNVKRWIGNGTLKLVERSLTHSLNREPNKDELAQAFNLFSNAYRECIGEHSELFPGVKDYLVKLLSHNIKIACITNKPLEFTEFLLQLNMISQFFSIICAGDNVELTKPDAWPLLYASRKLDVPIDQCLMVGDSKHDINSAKNAGCDVLAVSYGYNHGQNINELKPTKIIHSFLEINDL